MNRGDFFAYTLRMQGCAGTLPYNFQPREALHIYQPEDGEYHAKISQDMRQHARCAAPRRVASLLPNPGNRHKPP